MTPIRYDWRRRLVAPWIGMVSACTILGCASPPRADAADAVPDVDPAAKKLLAANGLYQRSLFKLAAQQYTEFLEAYPSHPDALAARYALGVCQYRLNDYPAAIEQLKKVVADSKFAERDEALAVIGYCELSTKAYDEALAHFSQIIEQYPKSKQVASAQVYRAQTLYLAAKYPEAIAACQQFIEQHPQDDNRQTALYFLALSQRSAGHHEQALAALQQLQKDFPKSAYQLDALLLSGQSLEAMGKPDAAIEQYRQMVEAAPETRRADAIYSLASALTGSGKYADAVQQFTTLIKQYPTGPYAKPAQLQLGLAQLALGKIDAARDALTPVVKGDPAQAAEAQYGLAQCDLADKKYDSARATLDALAQQTPAPANLGQILLYRAVCLMELQKFDEAATEFDAVASRYAKLPLAGDALYREAYCLHKLGKYDASHAIYRRIAAMPATDATRAAAELDAENLYLLGRYPDARTAFDVLADAASDPAAKARFQLRAGQCEYFAGNYQKAVERLAPLAANVQSPTSEAMQNGIFLLGDAQLQLGKNDEAIAALKQFLATATTDKREAQYKLGVAESRANHPADAQATWKALAQSSADSQWVQRALLELGQLQYKANDGDAAAHSLTKLLAAKPAPELAAPATYLLGWTRFDAKLYAQAADAWKQVVDQFPSDKLAPDAAFEEGVALDKANRSDEAVAVLQKFADGHTDSPSAPKARQLAASILTRQGKNTEAAQMLAELSKDPKASDALLYDLAWAQKGTKDNAAAERTYRRLIKDHPESRMLPAARTELAELLFADKKFSDAAELLDSVMAGADVEPRVAAAAQYRLGLCYQELGEPDKAAATFAAFADKYPEDPQATAAGVQAGLAYADTGKLEEAEKRFRVVLDKHPDHPDAPVAMLRLAEVQASQNDFDASLTTSGEFLARYPKSPLLYRAEFGRGWAQENLKKFDDARASYQKVIAATNTETAARAQFQLGETYLAEQKFEQAIPPLLAVEDVYRYPKWSARALFEAGRAFEQLKQPDQARAQYTQVLAKYKDLPEAAMAQDRLKAIPGS